MAREFGHAGDRPDRVLLGGRRLVADPGGRELLVVVGDAAGVVDQLVQGDLIRPRGQPWHVLGHRVLQG